MQFPISEGPQRTRGALGVVIIGLVIIGFGLALLAGNLGLADSHYLFGLIWPFGLTILGIATLLTRRHDQVLLGLVLIFAGVWSFASHQHWLRVSFWAVFGPTLVVLVGSSVIWRAFNRPAYAAGESYVRTFAILGGSQLSPKVPFKGADLTCVMGGAKLDLTNAPMEGDTATIDVFAMMGGAEILVPRDWDVVVKVTSLMGGVADKRRPATLPPTKHLIIQGTAVMGGVEIKD
jgi:hypothetical protein